jgi:hypothetical protein
MRAQVFSLEHRLAESLIKQADLETRQDDMEAHIEDLYNAIGAEADGGAMIKSRLKTQRPTSQRSARNKRAAATAEKEETH